jgi:hypothetical protein
MLESNSINCAEQAANNGRKQTDRRSPNRNGASSQRLYYCQTQQTPYTRQDLQHRTFCFLEGQRGVKLVKGRRCPTGILLNYSMRVTKQTIQKPNISNSSTKQSFTIVQQSYRILQGYSCTLATHNNSSSSCRTELCCAVQRSALVPVGPNSRCSKPAKTLL